MSMPTFWDLLQRLKDETGTSEAWVLKQAELNHGAFSAWRNRGIPVLPPRRTLLLLARAMKVDYEYLVDVILHDTGYLPGSVALEDEAVSRRWNNRGDPVSKHQLNERDRRDYEKLVRDQKPSPEVPGEASEGRGAAG